MNKMFKVVLAVLGFIMVTSCIFGLQHAGFAAIDVQQVARDYGAFSAWTLLMFGLDMIIWLGGAVLLVIFAWWMCMCRPLFDKVAGSLIVGVVAGTGAAGVSSDATNMLGGIVFGWSCFVAAALVAGALILAVVGLIDGYWKWRDARRPEK